MILTTLTIWHRFIYTFILDNLSQSCLLHHRPGGPGGLIVFSSAAPTQTVSTSSLISPHSQNCVLTVLNAHLRVQALEEDKKPGYTSSGTGQAIGVGKHRISHYHQQGGPEVFRSGKNVQFEIRMQPKMKRHQGTMTKIPEISLRQ